MLSQVRIIALISILSLGLFSCAAYKIGNAVKYKVKSGVSTGTPVFRYEITIKVKKATSFQKIEMDSLKT
mgnify:FL=1